MKVLVITNMYPPDALGGYERGCRQAVDALRARGHAVRVLTSAPRTPVPAEPHVARSLKLADIWDHYSLRRSAPATLHLIESEAHRLCALNVHNLLAEIAQFAPDVVYVWMLVGLGGLGLMASLQYLGVPWVWHLMDRVPLALCHSSGTLVPAIARAFERQLEGHFLVCSQQLREEIEVGGIRLPGEVEILPNWVEGPPPPKRQAYLQGGELKIVTAASLIDRHVDKGVDLLIEAGGLLKRAGQTAFSIDIYGEVSDPVYPTLAHKHGVADRVAFRGSRTQAELMTLFSGYDVFAFPTHAREPFGFAPLEAAACGCVPLMSQRCGIAEWLVHGVHCLKARRTPQAFARVLARILEGKIDLAPIGRRAASMIARDFHLSMLIERIEATLTRAAHRPRAALGTAAEAYRMAVLAEKLERILVQEKLCA